MEHWSGGPSERRPSRRASARDRGYARLLAMRQPRTCIPTVDIATLVNPVLLEYRPTYTLQLPHYSGVQRSDSEPSQHSRYTHTLHT